MWQIKPAQLAFSAHYHIVTLACLLTYFVFAVSGIELDTASAEMSNCSRVIDVDEGAPVSLYCNRSCISDNFTQWYYYRSANANVIDIVHTGSRLIDSSRGISVHYNQTVSQSVLAIEEVTTNVTGIYECSTNVGQYGGCRMRFCLSTGEYLTLQDLPGGA